MVGSIKHYYDHNKQLPFLFKIISVGQPLSLQAHPDKDLAKVLHNKDPSIYPDPNHKPELAIALTDFEVLCDFRPAEEILHFMKNIAPFRRLVDEKYYELYLAACQTPDRQRQKSCLKDCFKSLMTKDKHLVIKESKELLLNVECASQLDKDLLKLVIYLDKLYPGDASVLAPFFLNYLKMKTGQAIYLKANKLHAYIKGECIECMACSDNVVRAGLTTKYRDVNTLLDMLDYTSVNDRQDIIFTGVPNSQDKSILTFAPTHEFKVDKITISPDLSPTGEYTLQTLMSGSFILVFSGKAHANDFFDLKRQHKLGLGSSAYIPPKIGLKLSNIHGTLTIYRAYC